MNRKFFNLLCLFLAVSPAAFSQLTLEWMRYPSISPDGKTIAFAWQGDIYTVSSDGGEARALTVHPAFDSRPVWSPDGKTLAFVSDREGSFDIFTIPSAGGTPFRVTFHSAGELPLQFSADGQFLYFDAHLDDPASDVQFPSGGMSELYKISVKGGRSQLVMAVPGENIAVSKDGKKIYYHDWKGYEDDWRKHHTSAVTRDVWVYDIAADKHTKLSAFAGEDRNPVLSADESTVYFLTEQFGSNFNVAKFSVSNATAVTQVSFFKTHPVRFLSMATDGTLAYGYHGKLFIQKDGSDPKEVAVTLRSDAKSNDIERKVFSSNASGMAVSPDGKEIAFVVRGDVFVTSVEYGTTKRITSTPEQERSVSFSPDGKKILYAGERNGAWNLYETSLKYSEEKFFHQATLLTEETVWSNGKENFQPDYSPDGKEIAFLEDRTTLRVLNLASKQTRTVLSGEFNYSYSDGDQYFEWSPDSKWLLVTFFEKGGWTNTDLGLVKADGKSAPVNLTKSGYADWRPRWSMDGKAILWFNDRYGYRSHGSWGAMDDAYGMFLTKDAFDEFRLSKEELEYKKALDDAKKAEEEKAAAEKDKDKKGKKDEKKEEKKDEAVKPLVIDFDGLENRVLRLTGNSSNLSDAVLTKDGKKMYYLSQFEGGFDLWMKDFKENETKLLSKMKGWSGSLSIDKENKYLYLVSGGNLMRYDLGSNASKTISFSAEMFLDKAGERAYMFEHAWRQMYKKFYDPAMHGMDWEMLKKEYQPKLNQINNNRDFAELLAELLGEVNASHTGSGYTGPAFVPAQTTASLGLFFDNTHTGAGLRVQEVIAKGPFDIAGTKVKAGTIIEAINGTAITPETDWYRLLNGQSGKKVLLDLADGKTKWRETIKTINRGEENELLYRRWVESRKKEVERLSGGRLGYVHVRSMDSESFREVYSEALGRYRNAEALIVDTRFNGGGWLHDDLATFLNGKKYADLTPRGQYVASEPINKWYKPSAVIISESNYSDAHGFPFAYRALGVGKTVGMPVPGTMTAVWWESLLSGDVYFGIPMVGVKGLDGKYQENNQFEPDVKVEHDKTLLVKGRDLQLEKAVEVLLNELKK